MKHRETHPEPQPDCFGCKLQSLNWAIVPGAFRDTNSTTMFDRDQLMQQLGGPNSDGVSAFNEERVRDKQSDFNRHVGEFLDA